MAGIMNKTARQYNLKCIGKNKNRVTVRVAPGFNIVPDDVWGEFVSKDGKTVDPYVALLKKENSIDFGESIDDLELEQDADTKAKVKSTPPPKAPKKGKSSEE